MRYGVVSPVPARPRRPFGLLRRAGTRTPPSRRTKLHEIPIFAEPATALLPRKPPAWRNVRAVLFVKFRVRRRPLAWRNVRAVLFVKFRVGRRPPFVSGGRTKPEGWRRRFRGGRGKASKPTVESTAPIADRRFVLPPGSWSRAAQLHPQTPLAARKGGKKLLRFLYRPLRAF